MNNKKLILIISGLGLLTILGLIFLAVISHRAYRQREANMTTRQLGPNDSVEYTNEKVPKVGGPLNPGGPTFGYGAAADIRTTDHGWRFISNPDTRMIFIAVHNNSQHTWHKLIAQVTIYDQNGNRLRNDVCPFSQPLAPGQTLTQDFGPINAPDAAYTIDGYTGHL